jgi:hypothetical protein
MLLHEPARSVAFASTAWRRGGVLIALASWRWVFLLT